MYYGTSRKTLLCLDRIALQFFYKEVYSIVFLSTKKLYDCSVCLGSYSLVYLGAF